MSLSLKIWSRPHPTAKILFGRLRRFATGSCSSDDLIVKHRLLKADTHMCDNPLGDATASIGELLMYYRQMVTIRRMEIQLDKLYKQKRVRGFCHLSIGQEAIPIGIEAAIAPEDDLITAYRCHGFAYIRGIPIYSIIAELFGYSNGASKGKGGSMHIFGKHFYGGNGIVGAHVPVGAGLAFASKYLNKNTISVSVYGDGASCQGQVFEAFNMAKLWNLPCIFVCENNFYGMGTAISKASATLDLYKKGMNIPGLKISGMDVLSVRDAMRYARDWALSGKGPMIIQMDTYRYGGHSMSDSGYSYRTRKEIKETRDTNDPINNLRALLLRYVDKKKLSEIDNVVSEEIRLELDKAEQGMEPEPSELFTDVLSTEEA